MLKFPFVVLFLLNLNYISRVSSFPIIKASGVQWSEPKGTGKGNITLIMIPQENPGCNNDSDMLVAVKSDYQILSQDMQLLNLVVNENQSSKTNTKHLNKDEQHCDAPNNITAQQLDNNNIKCLNTANYFETNKNSVLNGVENNGIAELPSSLMQKNYSTNSVDTSTDSSTLNILKFLGITDSTGGNVYNNNESSLNNTFSTNSMDVLNLFKFFNLSESNSLFMNNNKTDNEGVSTGLNSSLTKTGDALNILPKLIQNSDSINSNSITNEEISGQGETLLRDSKTKTLNSGDLELTSEEEDSLDRIEYPGFNKNDKSNLEGNLFDENHITTTSTCLPLFNPFNDQFDVTSGTPSVATTNLLAKQSPSDQSVVSFKSVSLIPQGANQYTLTQGYMNLEESSSAPKTEICTTIIVQCNQATGNEVFDQISQMIKKYDTTEKESPELLTKDNKKIGSGITDIDITECFTVNPTLVSVKLQAAKQDLPKKITMEPPMDCETYLKSKGNQTSSIGSKDNNVKLNENDLTLPLMESSVFLANNKEMPKGGDIPIYLNTSLDESSLTDLQEQDDRMSEKAAELYSNNQFIFNIKDGIVSDTSSKPLGVKRNDKRKILLKTKNIGKSKIFYPDLSRILKMKFAGRNIVLEQNPSYRAGTSNIPCKFSPKTDPNNLDMEPDDNEYTDSQISSTVKITTQRRSNVNPEVQQGSSQLEITTKSVDDKQHILTTLRPLEKTTKPSFIMEDTNYSENLESIVTSLGKYTINEMESSEKRTRKESLQSDQTDEQTTKFITTEKVYTETENSNLNLLTKSNFKTEFYTPVTKTAKTSISPLDESESPSEEGNRKTAFQTVGDIDTDDRTSQSFSYNKIKQTTTEEFMSTTSSSDDEHYTTKFNTPVKKTTKTTTSPLDEGENPSEEGNRKTAFQTVGAIDTDDRTSQSFSYNKIKQTTTEECMSTTSSSDDEHYTTKFNTPVKKTAKTTTSALDEGENPSEEGNRKTPFQTTGSIDFEDRTLQPVSPIKTKKTSTDKYMSESEKLLHKNPTIKTICVTIPSDNENAKSELNVPTTMEAMVLGSDNSKELLDKSSTTEHDISCSTNDFDSMSLFQSSLKTTTKRMLTHKNTDKIINLQATSKPTDHSSCKSSTVQPSKTDKEVPTPTKLYTEDLSLQTTHNCNQNQQQKNNVYIPADSVKEIIIQIIRNTVKPGKNDSPKSNCNIQDNKESFIVPEDEKERETQQQKLLSPNTIHNHNEDNRGNLFAYKERDERIPHQQKLPSSDQISNDNEVDLNLHYSPVNGLDDKPYNYNQELGNSKTNFGGNLLRDTNQINDILYQNTLNDQGFAQQQELNEQIKPSKNIVYKEKGLASNILKLLLTDKPPINQL